NTLHIPYRIMVLCTSGKNILLREDGTLTRSGFSGQNSRIQVGSGQSVNEAGT
ncbi:hypothetical protein L9F63_015797, partial [Diploptera punctata]